MRLPLLRGVSTQRRHRLANTYLSLTKEGQSRSVSPACCHLDSHARSAFAAKVYDVEGLNRFCSLQCARRSHAYLSSLSPTSLFLRKGATAVEAALAAVLDEPANEVDAAAAKFACPGVADSEAIPPPSACPHGGALELSPGEPPGTHMAAETPLFSSGPPQASPAAEEEPSPAASGYTPPPDTSEADPTSLRMAGRIFERGHDAPPKPFASNHGEHDLIEGYRPRSAMRQPLPAPAVGEREHRVARFEYG